MAEIPSGAATAPDNERLVRIEVKLDQALANHTDHETRIRSLERAKWMAAGFAAAGGGIVGALVSRVLGVV